MRFLVIIQILAVSLMICTLSPDTAKAERSAGFDAFNMQRESFKKYGKYIWGTPAHKETQQYLNEAKIPHNSQWDDDTWTPQNWIDARGGTAMVVINGFYKAGIITDQYTDDDVPVLEVGQRFLDLSELEKRRVAAFFDHVFQMTAADKDGIFRIVFHKETYLFGLIDDRKLIGIFNAKGLHLQ